MQYIPAIDFGLYINNIIAIVLPWIVFGGIAIFTLVYLKNNSINKCLLKKPIKTKTYWKHAENKFFIVYLLIGLETFIEADYDSYYCKRSISDPWYSNDFDTAYDEIEKGCGALL